jgi:hypothetical protein
MRLRIPQRKKHLAKAAKGKEVRRVDPSPVPPDPAQPIEWTRKSFKRPRLLVTKDELQDIRKRLHRPIEAEMLERMTRYLENGKKRLYDLPSPGSALNNRGYTSYQAYAALLFCLTREKKYLIIAKQLTLALARCNPDFSKYKGDLAAAHALSCMAWCYDFLCEEWTSKEEQEILHFVEALGRSFFSHTATPLGYWSSILLQNHSQAAWTGIGQAGFGFHDKIPSANIWAAWAQKIYRSISWLQPPDGTNMEGCSYGSYGNERRVLFYESALRCLGENLFSHGEKQAGYWYLHTSLPNPIPGRNSFAWGDNHPRVDVHGCVHTLLSFARAFQDPVIQGLAMDYWRLGIGEQNSELTWLNLLFYDPNLSERSFSSQPLSRHFTDLDLVCARSSWRNPDATALNFLCGPYQGHRAMQKAVGDIGGAHCHADTASLQLYSRGEFLLTDPGYELIKRTSHHNTVLVDDRGQLGEGIKWLNVNRILHFKGWAEVLSYRTGDHYASWLADATEIYHPAAELKKFYRHVVYLQPDTFIVQDELETNSPKVFSQLWHSNTQFKKQSPESWRFTQGNAALNSWHFVPKPQKGKLKITSKLENIPDMKRGSFSHFELRANSPKTSQWKFLTVFHVQNKDEAKPRLKWRMQASNLHLTINRQAFRIRFHSSKAPQVLK